jgi:hypothetical protein
MTPSDRAAYLKKFRAEQKIAGVRRVNLTLTEAEFLQMSKSADAHGEKLTTHLKTRAFAHLEDRYVLPHFLAERMDLLLAVMRGIGNNLNQLARYSNEMRYFLDTNDVIAHLARLDKEVRQFLSVPPNQAGQKNKPEP